MVYVRKCMHHEPIRKILLVEDEAIIALGEQQVIERHGYDVVTCHAGEEAVEVVRAQPEISLVLMDIDLGAGIDGTEAARRVLAVRELPIVFLTSHAERHYIERVEEITRYGYVLKSSGELVLIQAIKQAFELFEAHRAVREKEARLSHLVNEAPVGIYQVWSSGAYLQMNDELARILGFDSPEEAIAHYTDIGTELYVDPTRRADVLALLAEHGTARDFRFRARRRDGMHVIIKSNVQVLGHDPEKGMLISGFSVAESEGDAAGEAEDEERQVLDKLLSGLNAGTWQWNVQTGDFIINERWASIVGYTLSELSPITIETWTSLAHPEDLQRSQELLSRHFRGESEYYESEVRMRHKDGSWVWVLDKGKLAERTASGEPLRMYGTHQEITVRKRVEEQLRVHKLALDSSEDLVVAVDPAYRYLFANRVFLERRRLREEDVVGLPAVDVLGESFFSALKPYLDRALAGETVSFDMPAEYPDGGTRQLHVSYFPLRDRDSIQGVVSHIRDISELKRTEEELRVANAEKDFLMNELNHRVKNNLAMITALINMKDAALGDVADLSDIRNQINAVRIVHDRLQHHGGSASAISLGRYVDDLLDAVFELSARRPVTVANRIGELEVSTRRAVTLGLILSELATNAMKHGFREGEEARFEVEITDDGDSGQHVMTVSNSGRPFPEDVDIGAPGGTGLRLVSSLVSQLDGAIELTPAPSANFRITLNLER